MAEVGDGPPSDYKGIEQFATELVEDILRQSLRIFTSNIEPTSPVPSALHEPGQWNVEDCSDARDDSYSEEETSSNEEQSHEVQLKSFANELCCDIIHGALQTFENSIGNNTSAKCDVIPSQEYPDTLSTERTELLYYADARPTLIIRSIKPNKANTGKDSHSKNKKKKTRYKKKLDKELAKLKPFKSNNKFLTTIEETPPVDDIDDPGVICAVCLDFYFHPYACKPCDHIFCEPCLRRLAKYGCDVGKITTCPICREPVHHCQKEFDLSENIKIKFPDDYRRRRNTDGHSKYMNHPLPSQPTQTVDSAIISHIIRRRRQERPRFRNPLVGYTPIRIDFRRYISLAVFIVIIKALALMVIVAVYNAVLVE